MTVVVVSFEGSVNDTPPRLSAQFSGKWRWYHIALLFFNRRIQKRMMDGTAIMSRYRGPR